MNLNVLHLLTASLGPVGQASGTAPAAYNQTSTVASVNNTLGLGTLGVAAVGEHLNTGVITSTAASPFTPTPTGTATSTINNLSTDLRSEFLGRTVLDLLGLGATTVTSTSSVSGFGGPLATGSSHIEGLTLGGTALGGVTINGALFANAAANTILFNAGGLEILLNEQLFSGDGLTSAGIQTNAIHAVFNNFLLGGNLLSGDLIVGHSQAGITGYANQVAAAVPEPAIWAELVAGFGIMGAAMRRRRAGAATA